jgi:adenosylcobyric acid synthase
MAKPIMLQGTGSNVGKSVLATALCRIFYQDGFRVVPFKSQNMALNSYVTRDGGEMGRAQVVQAEAAGIEPMVEMNPILLKPSGNACSQVVVMGRVVGTKSAREYHLEYNLMALKLIEQCLEKFRRDFDVIVIEGAGSPVEINLKPRDVVNMKVAKMARSPVLLVADIDRGGALASVVGTLELLDPDERDLVAGIIINKFRGDIELLKPALDFLETRTGKPVLGVVPWFHGFRIQDEDSVALEKRRAREGSLGEIDVAVVALPYISNFTDFDALEDEPDVSLRYVRKGQKIGKCDLIIIPGSKNTIADLFYLKDCGLGEEIGKLAAERVPVIGICGGYQILGREIHDPVQAESEQAKADGLGLLEVVTVFEPEKATYQAEGKITGHGLFLAELQGLNVSGYEIHMGHSTIVGGNLPAFTLTRRSGETVDLPDGAVSADGRVFGTYLHGIFDNDFLRRHIINALRREKGLAPLSPAETMTTREQRQRDYDRLALVVRESLDIDRIYEIMGLAGTNKVS